MRMNQQVVQNKNLLLKNEELTKHSVRVNPDDEMQVMEVWVRDITFLDIQAAAQRMINVVDGDITLNLESYWDFAFSNWIQKTNPSLSDSELKKLKGYVGEQISKTLPQPAELMMALQGGFTNPGKEE